MRLTFLVIGDKGVGKTTLISAFKSGKPAPKGDANSNNDEAPDNPLNPHGPQLTLIAQQKDIEVVQKTRLFKSRKGTSTELDREQAIFCWEYPGIQLSDLYTSTLRIRISASDVILLCFDLTDADTFSSAVSYIEYISKHADGNTPTIHLVGLRSRAWVPSDSSSSATSSRGAAANNSDAKNHVTKSQIDALIANPKAEIKQALRAADNDFNEKEFDREFKLHCTLSGFSKCDSEAAEGINDLLKKLRAEGQAVANLRDTKASAQKRVRSRASTSPAFFYEDTSATSSAPASSPSSSSSSPSDDDEDATATATSNGAANGLASSYSSG